MASVNARNCDVLTPFSSTLGSTVKVSCISTAEVFRRCAPGNPEHQKLSAGTIISTAGSHLPPPPTLFHRFALLAGFPSSFRSFVRSSYTVTPRKTAPLPLLRHPTTLDATMPSGYFVTIVIIFLPSNDSSATSEEKISIPSFNCRTNPESMQKTMEKLSRFR